MTKVLKSLFFVLMITNMACSNFEDKIIEPEKTRAEELTDTDYYWCEGKKISIRRSENKSFVLFRTLDKEALLSSLSEIGIQVNADRIHEYVYGGTDNSGDAAESFLDYEWAEVDINNKSAAEIPEVAYAAPYYYGPDGDVFPMTNLVYVFLKNAGDITLLKKTAKENNVGIIGEFKEIPLLYIVACTKESKGNAMEIANSFYESGLFNAEPAFISIKTL